MQSNNREDAFVSLMLHYDKMYRGENSVVIYVITISEQFSVYSKRVSVYKNTLCFIASTLYQKIQKQKPLIYLIRSNNGCSHLLEEKLNKNEGMFMQKVNLKDINEK